jgi:hypothetical protein
MSNEIVANIYQRINAVMKEVEYVQKDATITGGGSYKAVTHDNVTAVLRPLLVKHGIVVGVSQAKGKVLQMRDVKIDIKMHLYQGDYTVSFINIDQPEDRHSVQIQAHSTDTGDKSPGKAMSMATKYAMLKTFSIETGENEEGRYHETPLYTDLQKERFDELLDSNNGMGFACFSQEMGEEAMKALSGTFQAGKVSQGKKQMKTLASAGWDTLHDYVSQIQQRIADNDPSVLELTDELEGTEKRLVAGMLTDGEVAHLKKLKEIS